VKKKKKSEQKKSHLPRHRWEGIDDDAEEEGSTAFSENTKEVEERNEIEDRAANFNPFDEDKFEGNIS
jgi:hypothetical protein